MRWFACALVIGMVLRYFSYHSIGAQTYLTARGWYYVMGGLWEVLLCAALALVVWEAKKSAWRWLALYALVVSICESLQASVCRIAVAEMSSVPKGVNICDYVSGIQFTTTINTLYLIVLALIVGVILRGKN